MGAVVQINAVSTRVKDVPFGVAVSLLNASLGGVTSQKWEITAYSQDIYGNEPDPTNYSGWTLTGKNFNRTQSGSFPAVTFIPDISGNYIVRLTDTTNVDPLLWTVQTAVVRVKDQLSGGYIPAPGENDEVDTDRGWALERNQDLRIQSRNTAYGSHMRVVNLTGSTIARGKVAKIIGFTDMHTVGGNAVPAGATVKRERVAKIQLANSNDSDAVGAAYVVVIEPSGILNNGTGYALRNGMFEGVNPSSGATDINFSGFTAGSEIYLSTTGTIVNAPAGTNTVILGRCVEATSDGDVLFDGSYSRILPSKYIVQGTSDSRLPNAQFLGALATGLVKNTITTGVLSIAAAGTDYEVPLTFSTPGNTRTGNNVTADYITGKAGNQQWYGGLNASDGLTLDANLHATKGPLRLNAARMGFNRAAVSPTMYDFDLTQTFDETVSTTLDAFYISGSTVTFNSGSGISAATHVAYVSIGAPTFQANNGGNLSNAITDGISTVWIGGAPQLNFFDTIDADVWALVVNEDSLFNGQITTSGNMFLIRGLGGYVFHNSSGSTQIAAFGGDFTVGTGGDSQAINITSTTGNVGIHQNSPGTRNKLQVHGTQSATSSAVATSPLDAIYFDPSVISLSGSTAITTALGFNYLTVAAPIYNGTVTITAAATVAIGGPPSGTATITNPYALWIQSGNLRIASLNGLLKGTTGVVGTAAAGTDYQAPMSAADATINFPTATTIKVGTLTNKFIVQGTTDTMLSGAQFLGALGTGLVKNATTTGVLSIATSGTDYEPALTFNQGLTRASNTITNDLFTGKGSAQSVVGATSSGGSLTLSSTSSGTKGLINFGTSSYDENTNIMTVLGPSTSQNTPTLNVASSSASGVPVIMFKTSSTTLRGGIRGDFNGNMTWYALGGSHYFLTGGDFGVGNVKAKLFVNGNFLVCPTGVGSDTSDIGALLGVTGVSPQAVVTKYMATPATVTGASGSTFNAHWWDSVTQQVNAGVNITTATGYNFAVFNAPTINTTLNIALGATLYVQGAPAVTGGGSMTSPLSFWVDAGASRFDGTVTVQALNGMLKGVSGLVSVATSGTDYALPTVTLTAGNGLTGGGDISTNRTFDVVANADNSITVNANDIQVGVLATDAQHGNRGNGALHTVATTSINGFFAATDKSTLANSKFFVGNSTNAPASAQNLGALASGMLKHTVTTGTSTIAVAVSGTDFELPLTFSTGLTRATQTITADLSTGKGTGQSVYGGLTSGDLTLHSNTSSNGKIFFSSSNNGFNESTGNFWLGLSSPISTALVHVNRDSNALNEVFNTNPNTGSSAGASFILGLDTTNDLTKRFQITMTGTNFTTAGLISAQSAFLSHQPSNGAPFIISQQGTGDIIWTTTSSVTERARLYNRGEWLFTLGSTQITSGGNINQFDIETQSRLVSNGVAGGLWATVNIRSDSYAAASGTASATTLASLYVVNAPVVGSGFSATNVYSIYVDDGLSRFDGAAFSDAWGSKNVVFDVTCSKISGSFTANSYEGGQYWMAVKVRDTSGNFVNTMYVQLYERFA